MSAFRNISKILILSTILVHGCSGKNRHTDPQLNSSGYCILSGKDDISEQWGNYLYHHLSRRCKDTDIILRQEKNDRFKTIYIEVDDTLGYDYSIEHSDQKIALKAKNEKGMIWLIYQFIKLLSYCDNRIEANDLPPAVIDCKTCRADFDFSYREPFFGPNLKAGYAPIIGTHTLEEDWGIWGHNLKKVLTEDQGDLIYAKQAGVTQSEQYCFSNEETFRQIKEYITDYFGNNKSYRVRFMIMPNDNQTVCLCKGCKAAGNTEENATPAISKLIVRLAKEFPYHMFFTSSYLTTRIPPEEKWPKNTGVMISTINLPKGIALNDRPEIYDFLNTLDGWKQCVSDIYIWDYAANFDDFLTPLPVLEGLKKQLQFYGSKGITGVFLNASGYDYSPFDDVKTFVAGALMINTDLSVDSLCEHYFKQMYPQSGDVLCNYYLSLEKKAAANNMPYNIYGGFEEYAKNSLNEKEFVAFYDALDSLTQKCRGEEKIKIEKLYTALSFTRLQIAYTQREKEYGFAVINEKQLDITPGIRSIVQKLSRYKNYKDLVNYKENKGNLAQYLCNWNTIFRNAPIRNLLMNEQLKIISRPDEGFENPEILNNCVPGFDDNYHQGWYLSSLDDLHIRLDVRNINYSKKLKIRFLTDEKHHIYPPDRIVLYKDYKMYKEIKPVKEQNKGTSQTMIACFDVDFGESETAELIMYRKRNYGKSILACDEIQLTD